MSTSSKYRGTGNNYFVQAKQSISIDLKRRNFWNSLDWYNKAEQAAVIPNEKAKANKNLAVVNKYLGTLEWGVCESRGWDHFVSSIKHYVRAAGYAQNWHNSNEWLDDLSDNAGDCLFELLELTMDTEASKEHLNHLHKISQSLIHADHFKTPHFLEIVVNYFCEFANRYLHLSLFQVKSKNFSLAYQFSMEMHFPLEEAVKFASRDEEVFENMINEIEVLKTDKNVQEKIFHANLELNKAKELLTNLSDESSQWIVEGCLALDSLRIGYQLVSEEGLDFSLEAEICTYIGVALFKIMKRKSDASTFIKRSIEMVLAFESDNILSGCRTTNWFQLAEKTMREIQEEVLKEEAKSVRAQKQKLRDDGTVEALQKAKDQGLQPFLQHIYHDFPIGDNKMPEESLGPKKQLQLAMKVYHPDKHFCTENDTEEVKYKYVLSNEITAHLSFFYSRYAKGMD